VKENLHAKIDLATPVTVSEKTAQRWLKGLGLNFERYRPDVSRKVPGAIRKI
jgi:hypothetical protein